MYREGLAWFAEALATEAGEATVYARGATRITGLVSTRVRSMLAGLTDLGDREGQYHDRLFVKADLAVAGTPLVPAAGDLVEVTHADGTQTTYEVSAEEKDGFVAEEAAGGTMLRVHLKD